jgi:hypothetical protein
MAIQELGTQSVLYDVSRPFLWELRSTSGATNIVYKVQKYNFTANNWQNITGLLRQPYTWSNNMRFYIDPSQILIDYVKTNIRGLEEGGSLYLPDNYIWWRLTCVEEFTDSDGYLYYNTNQSQWYNTNSAYAIDGATTHSQTFGKTQYNWIDMCRITSLTGLEEGRFLSNRPNGDRYSRMTLCKSESDYIHAFVLASGVKLIGNVTLANGVTSADIDLSGPLPKGVNSLGVGPQNIIDFIGGSVWDAYESSHLITEICYWLENDTGVQVTPANCYEVKRNCCTQERCRVYWKNRKGGIDGYTFDAELIEETTIKSKVFQRRLGYRRHESEDELSLGFQQNNTFGQKTRIRGSVNIKAQDTLTVTSRHEASIILNWLSEIYTSPKIWIESPDNGELQAAVCTSKKAVRKYKGKKTGQMKLALQLSNQVITQR